MKLQKKIVASLAVMLQLTSLNAIAFADCSEVNNLNHEEGIQNLKVRDLLDNPRFKELNIDEESLQFFIKIEEMNDNNYRHGISSDDIGDLYSELGDVWGHLTDSEKLLCIADPASAALAYYCVGEANKLTLEEYGCSRVGDESDAFRHTVWNALMQKYIGGNFPEAYATAHEDHSSEELEAESNNSNGEPDGYTLQDHHDMDLNNNEVGRSLVHWTEYFTISHEEIVSRVYDAISHDGQEDGKSYYLYSY